MQVGDDTRMLNWTGSRLRAHCLTIPLAVLLSLIATHATAQTTPSTFDLDKDRNPITSIDTLWRFHPGDDAQWASPSFDDSAWPLVHADRSWTSQGFPNYTEYGWYRFTLRLPPRPGLQGLLLSRIYSGYQVFADGRLIGSKGSTSRTLAPVFAVDPHIFPLPLPPGADTNPTSIHIAIRVWEYRPIVSWGGAGTLSPGAAAGNTALLTQRLQLLLARRGFIFANVYSYCLLAFLVGLTTLALFLFRRKDREYLWFAVVLLVAAADAALNIYGYDSMRFLIYRALDEIAVAIGAIAAVTFFSILLELRGSPSWRIVCYVAAISPLSLVLYYLQATSIGVSYSLQLVCLLPAYLWIIIQLSLHTLRGNTSARLLLAPSALLYGYAVAANLAYIWYQVSGNSSLSDKLIGPILQRPYPLVLVDVLRYIFVLALLIFLVQRFSLARREEERFSTEFAAARSVQSLLVPKSPPPIPGYSLQSVYIPASEVGGDFFQVHPSDDGSLLVIIGDVSGKGLRAAMTVSTIVGALRGCRSQQPPMRSPANILSYLNRVLHGQISGFVTCCAILLTPDGSLTVSNAGHISPYLNGSEFITENGLPLGLADAVPYVESTGHLAPNTQLTLVTDGVVEARSNSGELFGFDRTTAISTESAQSIANAAQSFGQDDDITVLTIARL
jgi:phosphoserine phosphatase RsbU/P